MRSAMLNTRPPYRSTRAAYASASPARHALTTPWSVSVREASAGPARSSCHSDYPLGQGAVSLFSARSMDMTWLGHACVRMRGREGVVLADPPDPKSGHAIPKTEAAIVTISHEHPGHSSLKSVGGEPVVLRGPGEYEVQEVLVTGIGTFHDDSKGSARGPEVTDRETLELNGALVMTSVVELLRPQRARDVCQNARAVAFAVDDAGAMRER